MYWRRCDVCKSKLYGDEDPPVCSKCSNCCCTCEEKQEVKCHKLLADSAVETICGEIGGNVCANWEYVTCPACKQYQAGEGYVEQLLREKGLIDESNS